MLSSVCTHLVLRVLFTLGLINGTHSNHASTHKNNQIVLNYFSIMPRAQAALCAAGLGAILSVHVDRITMLKALSRPFFHRPMVYLA